MPDIRSQHEGLNIEALDETLRAALGEQFSGLSMTKDWVTLHLSADATSEQTELALRLLREHDPTTLTPRQQAAAEQATLLAAARAQVGPLFDPSLYADDARLHALARRIYWLELELRELRGM